MPKMSEEELMCATHHAMRDAGASRSMLKEDLLIRADPMDLAIMRRYLQEMEDRAVRVEDEEQLEKILQAQDAFGRFWARHRS